MKMPLGGGYLCPVTWQSQDLTMYFHSLDCKYSHRQSYRGKDMMVQRVSWSTTYMIFVPGPDLHTVPVRSAGGENLTGSFKPR